MTDQTPIKVLIVDDHAMVRRGLAAFLKAAPDLELVGDVTNGMAAVAFCQETPPDVVLMDLQMPGGMDGVETTRKICELDEDIQVIVITSFGDDDLVNAALQAGAISYLFKDIGAEELADAIRAAHSGESRLAPGAMQALIGSMNQPPTPGHDLTPREREVLELVIEGLNNTEIAEELVVSRSTIKTHVSSILSKLGVSSRVEAVTVALQNNLFD